MRRISQAVIELMSENSQPLVFIDERLDDLAADFEQFGLNPGR